MQTPPNPLVQKRSVRAFVLVAIGMSLVVWDIMFNLGVYHEIFYFKVFAAWVICIVIFIANFCLPKKDRYLNRWGMIAMLTPSLWIFAEYWGYTFNGELWFASLSLHVAFLVMLVCLPYSIYIIVTFMYIEIDHFNLRYIFALLGIMLFVSVLGFILGSNHNSFLNCDDFDIAGAKLPVNCYVDPEPNLKP